MYALELAGEDDEFAAAEARAAAAGVEVLAPGVALAGSLDAERVRTLAFTRRASELVGRTGADVASAVALLEAASFDRQGSVAVRARDVRSTADVDTRHAERALGDVLVDRGYAIDLESPDHELRALFADGDCVLGWLVAESERDYGDRRPTDRPFFQPGSMGPQLARALCNLAGVRRGATVLDPMCGTGGVLIEAGLLGARPLGTDAQRKMVAGTRENLRAFLDDERFSLALADATRLPFPENAVDAAVFDVPYGRQSKIARHDLAALVGGALREARRVTAGRAAAVGDRDWRDAAEEAGWTVENSFERRVHRSLTRHVLMLS